MLDAKGLKEPLSTFKDGILRLAMILAPKKHPLLEPEMFEVKGYMAFS